MPAPFGPRSANTVPGSTDRETSSNARFEPKRFDTPSTSMAIMLDCARPSRVDALGPLTLLFADAAMTTALSILISMGRCAASVRMMTAVIAAVLGINVPITALRVSF